MATISFTGHYNVPPYKLVRAAINGVSWDYLAAPYVRYCEDEEGFPNRLAFKEFVTAFYVLGRPYGFHKLAFKDIQDERSSFLGNEAMFDKLVIPPVKPLPNATVARRLCIAFGNGEYVSGIHYGIYTLYAVKNSNGKITSSLVFELLVDNKTSPFQYWQTRLFYWNRFQRIGALVRNNFKIPNWFYVDRKRFATMAYDKRLKADRDKYERSRKNVGY